MHKTRVSKEDLEKQNSQILNTKNKKSNTNPDLNPQVYLGTLEGKAIPALLIVPVVKS
jgi:hypothetical protein